MCHSPLMLADGLSDDKWEILLTHEIKVRLQNLLQSRETSYLLIPQFIATDPLIL